MRGIGESTDDVFRSYFEDYGEVSHFSLPRNADGTSFGSGFVSFTAPEVGNRTLLLLS